MKYEQTTDFYGYTLYSAELQTIDEDDLAYLKTIANTTYHKGYFIYDSYQNINFSYGEADTYYTKLNVYPNITAFIELEDDTVFEHLMGRSPRASNELVISEYLADYMIASQEVEPGSGWDYVFLKNITKCTCIYIQNLMKE